MLHDPRKEHPSLPGFIGWLETKNPKERYNWCYPSACACAQYAQECLGWSRSSWITSPNFEVLNRLAYEGKWTFGALLERAKAHVAE